MNWANRLTVSRLALTILFVIALNSSWAYGRTAALDPFLVAGVDRFLRRRNGASLRDRHKFREVDGSAGGQDDDGGRVHLSGSVQGDSGLGGDDRGGARFFDHRVASDGERAGTGASGGATRQAQDFMADHHDSFFPRAACGARIEIRRL